MRGLKFNALPDQELLLSCRSMGGQQPGLPQSPRDVDEYSIDVDRPGENPGYISLFFEVCSGS